MDKNIGEVRVVDHAWASRLPSHNLFWQATLRSRAQACSTVQSHRWLFQ
jgi:hypothetical protein